MKNACIFEILYIFATDGSDEKVVKMLFVVVFLN